MTASDQFDGLNNGRILGGALLGLGLIGLVAITAYFPPVHTQVQVAKQILTKTAPKPTGKEVAEYSVPASDPRYIAIPSLGIGNTPVLAFGLTSDGTIATPNSIYETGWYQGSSKPGQPGAMFIYGHIASWTNYSVFAKLSDLKQGDEVVITRGDNALFHYQVTAEHIYPYNAVDMTQVLTSVAQVPELNIMTCAGQIITVGGIREYSERLVVFTKQV